MNSLRSLAIASLLLSACGSSAARTSAVSSIAVTTSSSYYSKLLATKADTAALTAFDAMPVMTYYQALLAHADDHAFTMDGVTLDRTRAALAAALPIAQATAHQYATMGDLRRVGGKLPWEFTEAQFSQQVHNLMASEDNHVLALGGVYTKSADSMGSLASGETDLSDLCLESDSMLMIPDTDSLFASDDSSASIDVTTELMRRGLWFAPAPSKTTATYGSTLVPQSPFATAKRPYLKGCAKVEIVRPSRR